MKKTFKVLKLLFMLRLIITLQVFLLAAKTYGLQASPLGQIQTDSAYVDLLVGDGHSSELSHIAKASSGASNG